ncbi:Two-component system sensor histidine kinase [hydrothermal vent metagenome]|uniref:Two-component system sensor histidine kinase n=1 Tax=hydrothermal vent metagenome TaxID=652676 RepID=A0A3B0T6I9_9ZZZZ
MAYRKYKSALFFRVIVLFLSLVALAFAVNILDFKTKLTISVITILPIFAFFIISFRGLYKFLIRRFDEMDDFFESVKYRDFSRWFTEKSGHQDIRELHKGFNEVNKTIKEINSEKEAQHLYLQKILELVGTGIIAYNTDTGKVLWVNESFKKNLDIPSLKSIDFVANRKPKLYKEIFEENHAKGNTISIEVEEEKTKILIASSIFKIKEDSFKLIVLQNIDDTLSRTESEAWKKLLSVMTHEIMNSIAPISSLAETLQSKVQLYISEPDKHELEIHDLDAGIESIKKRSEGLLKFAKTYRSLNKITKLNLTNILVSGLFENIINLMKPSLESKHIIFDYEMENYDFYMDLDTYLIEQVIINLVLNSVEACKESTEARITLSAHKNSKGNSIIRIRDNGKGIPDEIIDDIFVPFFSTKKNGSGIGLSLCKQIVLLHNGKIQIKSVVGKGTVISLVF